MMHKAWMYPTAAVAMALMLSSGSAASQDKPAGCNQPGTPEIVEGQVVKVDMEQGKLTLRAANGTLHEFQASRETLQDYKMGDSIKAKLRRPPECAN